MNAKGLAIAQQTSLPQFFVGVQCRSLETLGMDQKRAETVSHTWKASAHARRRLDAVDERVWIDNLVFDGVATKERL